MDATAARAGLALVALLLTAWFAALAVNDRIGHAASKRVVDDPDMSDADWERSMDDLRRAERLNPGSEWSLTRASYLLSRDDPRRALEIAEDVVRREPENLDAWGTILTISRVSGTEDERRAERAREEIRRLNPLAGSDR